MSVKIFKNICICLIWAAAVCVITTVLKDFVYRGDLSGSVYALLKTCIKILPVVLSVIAGLVSGKRSLGKKIVVIIAVCVLSYWFIDVVDFRRSVNALQHVTFFSM